MANFEGLSNQDNFNLFGFRVNPPDPVGDVGPNHYVEMVNLAFAVYDKQGNLLLGPIDTGTLWAGFAVPDCTDPSGDPIVLYDQLEDRWILTQFVFGAPAPAFSHQCVAVSKTGDPLGAYYLYDFPSPIAAFQDYPHLGVWPDGYYVPTSTGDDVIEKHAWVADRQQSFWCFHPRSEAARLDQPGSAVYRHSQFPCDPCDRGNCPLRYPSQQGWFLLSLRLGCPLQQYF